MKPIIAALLLTSAQAQAADTRSILQTHCLNCHSTAKHKGDLDLESSDINKEPTVWENVLDQVTSGEMPPKKEKPLAADEKRLLVDWVRGSLDRLALAHAGDPGPVVMRRLSNMEYTYTVRDLTGVESLDPAKEFPVDGAAGEGFTNAGAALVMSPALLTKYLDAAKLIASHAVLTPEGFHFSSGTTARDWTDETLAKIRAFYARYTEAGTSESVVQQGIKLETSGGGQLPVAKYLSALMKERTALQAGTTTIAVAAKTHNLNAKYASTLWSALNDTKPSLVLDGLRAKWREGTLTAAEVSGWQQALWRFASVGHIGKKNGPKSWQEPVSPLAMEHETRLKLSAPASGDDVALYLTTSDAADGADHDAARWVNPRFVAPGRRDLPLREVRALVGQLEKQREAMVAMTAKCLAAAADADASKERTDVAELAKKHGVDAGVLASWLDYLGIGTAGGVTLEPLLVKKMESAPNYAFIKGWTGEKALSVLANSSDTAARIPGTMKPHSVATHPSPTLASVIAWRSPVAATLKISGTVQDAHTACGNGITWSLERRRGHSRDVLASGVSDADRVISMGRHENIAVQAGEVIAVVIGPRDGNHACDLTAVDLTLNDGAHEWDLAKDISPDILSGNPHADRLGHKDVWYFLSEPETRNGASMIPAGSLLAQWRTASDPAQRERLAGKVMALLQSDAAAHDAKSPDGLMRSQLLSFTGPLLSSVLHSATPHDASMTSAYGLDEKLFTDADLKVTASSVIEVRLPASLVDGMEFVSGGRLDDPEGSVQMQVLTEKPQHLSGIAAGRTETAQKKGQWSDNNLRTINSAPILVSEGSAARKRFEAAFDEFRQVFPIALCYTKIVPVDEVVTLTLFHREDDQLRRLMLSDAEGRELDRLWDELRFVSEAPLKQVDVFEQLWQFATQDAKPDAFEPMREPIMRGADAFKKLQVEVAPKQVQAVLDFAGLAWRRPLKAKEKSGLESLYDSLRKQGLAHPKALRLLLARVFVAPAFLYRGEKASPGPKATPVNDWELATRLSYFLWSSMPDDELRQLANAGRLHEPAVLAQQAKRMLTDPRVRRLATEFGCQWLHVRDVAALDEKSERHFPEFAGLREDMQEEVTRFIIDLFQSDRSVLALLDADHTFVNDKLAAFYGLPTRTDSNEWRRVEGLHKQGRGGILGFAATLAKQSGASRTSAILRGGWLTEVVLGEKLPIPPKGVPVLPEEAPEGLTERQLTERHSQDPKCAGCHQRLDPYGFALEGFDAIGRARTKDAAGLTIDTRAKLPSGAVVEGLDGLRSYLLTSRRDDFLRQFSRKLLGYALGRSVQFSDKPLIESMLTQLKSNELRASAAVDLIVRSPQFREVRGRDFIVGQ